MGGRRAAHLREVLRVEVGSSVQVGVIGGGMGQGTIEQLANDEIVLRVVLDQPVAALPDFRLVLALPRPHVLRRVLQCCAAFGVQSIFLINSWRVEKSYWGSPVLDRAAIEKELILGLEQGRHTRLPQVRLCPRFKPFVEDDLRELSREAVRLVGQPGVETACPCDLSEAVTLAVGPEGGFIPYEIESLEQIGFQPVHLGSRILRVEQAVPAFLGRLIGLS